MLSHENVDSFNRYLNTTVGREKLCRLVQYFARFYAFYLLRQGAPDGTVERWVQLKSHLGNGRKFFRLLKPVEFAQVAVKSLTIQDEVLRYTAVGKQAGMFFYYLSEVFVLTNAIQFYKPNNIKQIAEFGQKCWLVGLISSLLSNLYKLKQLSIREHMLKKSQKAINQSDSSELSGLNTQEKALARDKYNTKYQAIQDIVDTVIPLSALGLINTDEGIVGLAGMVTSLLAMNSQWKKLNG